MRVNAGMVPARSKEFDLEQSAITFVETPRIRVLPDGRLSREDAATYLGLKAKTLAMWSVQGKGPTSVRVGGRIFYFKQALDQFVGGEVSE